jgi:pyridoxal phosphate enzyme (YggS family)
MNDYTAIPQALHEIRASLPDTVTLVAVSKTHPTEAVRAAYAAGQRIFGENKVQELVAKAEALPKDIEWHLIGHLQTNKVKFIAPFVHMIHAIDSVRLLEEVNKRALQNARTIDVLLQVHIAEEESKFGFDDTELHELVSSTILDGFTAVRVRGLMGMATFTDDQATITREFRHLKARFDELKAFKSATLKNFDVLSMGMSGDYETAISCGSTMIRVGSRIFGSRATV